MAAPPFLTPRLNAAQSGFWNLRASDVVQLLGTLVMIWVVAKAPGWAVRAQWELQLAKEERERKLWVFKTLMRTRQTPVSVDHVQASDSKADIGIREAWGNLLMNLNIKVNEANQDQINAWSSRNQDLLVELLSNMGATLNYAFSFTHLKDRTYHPRFQGELDTAIVAVNKGWVEVLNGRKPLKMEIVNPPVSW